MRILNDQLISLFESSSFFLFFILSAVLLIIESFVDRHHSPSSPDPHPLREMIQHKQTAPFNLSFSVSWVIPSLVVIGIPLADVWLKTGGAAGLGAHPGVLPLAGGVVGRWVARELVRVLAGGWTGK